LRLDFLQIDGLGEVDGLVGLGLEFILFYKIVLLTFNFTIFFRTDKFSFSTIRQVFETLTN
jgi:hypothetical protein